MVITLRELKAEARTLARVGELGAALAAYDHILASNPLDYDSRLKVADLLARTGDAAGAAAVYRAVALECFPCAGHSAFLARAQGSSSHPAHAVG